MDTSDDKKTRHKLMKFLTRRPTLQAVRDKGYIKGITERRHRTIEIEMLEWVFSLLRGGRYKWQNICKKNECHMSQLNLFELFCFLWGVANSNVNLWVELN